MNICVVAYKFGNEKEIGEHLGTYHYFIEKMRTLVRKGHNVWVVAPWLLWRRRGSTEVDGVRIVRYYPPFQNRPKLWLLNKLLRFWYIKATARQVLRLDRHVNLDVVYVWQARETGYAVAKVAHHLRCPFIFRQITAWQWHFERSRLDREAQMKFARTIYEKAKKVVFVSRAASQEGLRAGLPPEKVAIIGVGVDTDIFVPRTEKTKNLTLLFVGRISFAEKGLGVLLSAMPEILKAHPQAKLVIVGGGQESARVEQMARQLNLGEHVAAVGKKPFLELPRYIHAADVLVVPSLWLEHFGQVTVDAMACGVPVITSDAGASPEINLDGETGFVVPAGDSGKLAQAVIKLFSDDELRLRLGRQARSRVLQNYTYDVLVNKFLEVVRNV